MEDPHNNATSVTPHIRTLIKGNLYHFPWTRISCKKTKIQSTVDFLSKASSFFQLVFALLVIWPAGISLANTESIDYSYSTKLSPQFAPEYYIDQGMKYFDTLDTYASRSSKPKYSRNVLRWEWYPWLKLTGYKRWMMKLDVLLILYPTAVIDRDCRFFKVQPFSRCRVAFSYKGVDELIKIYEEFTFNDKGEITFIEAWTDEAPLLPMNPELDPWAELENVKRLSTKVPGLGTPKGLIKLSDKNLKYMATQDEDVLDLTQRMKKPIRYWLKELYRSIKEHREKAKEKKRLLKEEKKRLGKEASV